jgi:hypothetical protein
MLVNYRWKGKWLERKSGRWFDVVDEISQFLNLWEPELGINKVDRKPAVTLPWLHLHGSTSLSVHEAKQEQNRINLTRLKNFIILESLSYNSKALVKGT